MSTNMIINDGRMTLELLKGYRSRREEIAELSHKLEHLGEGDSLVGNSIVFDYRTGYPRPQTIIGIDREKFYRLNTLWRQRKEQLEEECSQVEDFIEGIPDSMTRRIFRMYYIDNMTQRQIAEKVHIDKSTVARKIEKFLKIAPNAPNAPL